MYPIKLRFIQTGKILSSKSSPVNLFRINSETLCLVCIPTGIKQTILLWTKAWRQNHVTKDLVNHCAGIMRADVLAYTIRIRTNNLIKLYISSFERLERREQFFLLVPLVRRRHEARQLLAC